MIKKLQNKLQSEDGSRLAKNFISLITVQGLNYILPLITVPYITRVLGVTNLGVVGISTALNTYFTVFTDYGFNLTATKEISINRENKGKVSEIFSTVMLIKSAFFLLSFILMMVIVLCVPMLRADLPVYIVNFGIVLGNALFPIWFFQGIERMKYITYLNIASRVAVTILIFVLVKNKGDLLLYVGLNSLANLAIGIVSLMLVIFKFGVKPKMISLATIKTHLIEGWYVFISSVSNVIYSSSTMLVIGFMLGKEAAGLYTAADKIRIAVQGLIPPLFQTVYPHVSKIAQVSKEKALEFIRKELLIFGGAGIIISVLICLNSKLIVEVYVGPLYEGSIGILRILAFAPFALLIGNILTVQCLLSLGMKKEYSNIYIKSSVFGIIAMFILTYALGVNGAALAVVITELLIVGLTVYELKSNKISLMGMG